MSLRFLFEMFSPLLPDRRNISETMDASERAINYIQAAAKLHIGMLTVSLLVGLAFGGFVIYTYLKEKEVFLVYIRNLVIALVCRTFFTVIFDGVVLLEGTTDVAGANTLSSFEQIFLNLVLAFWLNLTVYAHARVQRNFKSEPTLRLYQYGIPAVAVFFAFIWIFVMQGAYSNEVWWARVVILSRVLQWIVNSANLLFLLIQLGLVVDICRMMMARKGTLDNDTLSLLWRVAALFGALVFIFWLQFGLSLGPYITNESYLNFFYFMDGTECALVCLCLYFFHKWVVTIIKNNYGSFSGSGDTLVKTESVAEELLPDGRGICTIDSVFVTNESGRWKTSREEDSKDVLYSNVVEPHRLQKTLELYKRLNIIPSQVTVVEGEKFYDCQIPTEHQMENRKSSLNIISKEEEFRFKNDKIFEPTQKKNAFYASKYLILDSKESASPKYLDPSVSSGSLKNRQKDEQTSRENIPPSVDTGKLVRTWLKDHSDVMEQDRKPLSVKQDRQTELRSKKFEQKAHEYDFSSSAEALYDSPGPMLSRKDNVHKIATREVNESEISTPSQPVEHIKEEKKKEFQDNRKQMEASKVPDDINKNEELKPKKSQPLDVSKLHPKQHEILSEEVALTPKNLDLPEAQNQPTEPPNSFLTYNELLEFRSKDRVSDGRPLSKHSFSESIFSKLDLLFNAGGTLLNSLTGFSQTELEAHEENNFRTEDMSVRQSLDISKSKPKQQEELKEPETQKTKTSEDSIIYDTPAKEPQDDLKFETKVPRTKQLKEERHEEPKSSSQLPEKSVKQTVEDDEGTEIRLEGRTTNGELATENKTKINISEMPQFEEQVAIYKPDGTKPPVKPRQVRPLLDSLDKSSILPFIHSEETSSDSEFSIERRQSAFSYRRLSDQSQKCESIVTSGTAETQTDPSEKSDEELKEKKISASSSASSFSLREYYTQILAAGEKFENQTALRFKKKT